MTASRDPANFSSGIQGLRAVAVLLVLFYHAGSGVMTGGFVGVDVFFVISGYLITDLLLRELEATNRIRLPEFYARRIRRLVPAAALVIASTVAVGFVLYSPFEQRQHFAAAFATALYLGNFWFAKLATDYLAAGTEASPLLHMWSLAVEEQF